MTREMMQLKIEKSIARAKREGFWATADALSEILEEIKRPRHVTHFTSQLMPKESRLD